MNSFRFARYFYIGLAIYGLLLGGLWLGNPDIAEENRLMENLQALFLLGGLACALCSALNRKSPFPAWIPWMLALFFLTLFLREIDLDRLDLPGWLISLGSGKGRNLMLGLGWLAGIGLLLRRRSILWPEILRYLHTPAFVLFVLGACCYVLSIPFDKRLFFSDRAINRFLEELTENFATWLLFGGALVNLLAIPLKPGDQHPPQPSSTTQED